jgi:hypothetical protein
MSATATALRKNLFKILDSVIEGEAVVISYKGAEVRLEPPSGGSKLARAVRRDTLLVDPNSIIGPVPEIEQALDAKWAAEDKLV